ncbi:MULTISPECIES: endonuclease/exonuclease/phosphatase family protein [unclassified Streptomyces]|uniref:endonuclease/exonuclease/phosphatase family protein n=1 Tax=unclassified Streptomyces TaxID=2593676 RepID=UPI000F6B521B|nr:MULTISPECIES: endonuclease/exonuclease/phosphatase family protein [unclassified Streptomyces]AZM59495.1 Tat pathway signal protein [Streptomyces sp. WAC 01438]RSM95735.1 Tat pathway signal protein [Streptomyces sp. WAC 01420]
MTTESPAAEERTESGPPTAAPAAPAPGRARRMARMLRPWTNRPAEPATGDPDTATPGRTSPMARMLRPWTNRPAEPATGDPDTATPGRARRVARVVRLWYGRVLVGVAGVWLLYAVVRWLVSGRWHWSILLDAAPPLLLVFVPVVLLLAGAAACGRRRPWALGLSSAALLLALTTGSGINWPALWRDPGPVPPGALHVVSLNTQYWGQESGVDKVYELLHKHPADVYLLQEHVAWKAGLGEEGYSELRDDDRLREEFPGYHIARRGELLTLSRFPIVASPPVGPAIEFDDRPETPFKRVFDRDKVMRTDLEIGDEVLSVYNVHVTVPLAVDNLDPFSDFDHDAYFRRKFDWRREEIRGLEDDLDRNAHPTLISGDFNATASMREMDGIRDRADDALRANDDLFPTSWRYGAPAAFEWDSVFNRTLPLWRVDWSFTRHDVRVHRYDLLSSEGLSEHLLQDLWVSL